MHQTAQGEYFTFFLQIPLDSYLGAVLFLISQAITLFGSQIVAFAIVWYVTLETVSGLWVALLTICSLVPQFLMSFLGADAAIALMSFFSLRWTLLLDVATAVIGISILSIPGGFLANLFVAFGLSRHFLFYLAMMLLSATVSITRKPATIFTATTESWTSLFESAKASCSKMLFKYIKTARRTHSTGCLRASGGNTHYIGYQIYSCNSLPLCLPFSQISSYGEK